MIVRDVLRNKLNDARQGRVLWLHLTEKYGITEKDWVFLFPEEGTECNRIIIEHMGQFIEEKCVERVFLLTFDDSIHKVISKSNSALTQCKVIVCDIKQAELLMTYYTVQTFSDRFIIASLDKPEGRLGSNLKGHNGVTVQDLVKVGILGFKEI